MLKIEDTRLAIYCYQGEKGGQPSVAEGFASNLRIPLGKEAAWSREVLGYPSEYLAPCFIAIGKPAEGAEGTVQKEYSLTEKIHYNGW